MDATVNKTAEAGTTQTYDHGISFGEAFRVWLRVAVLSFGGPAGQIAVMHRILVEEKNWISESRFLHALNYCMLLPGPEAQQLATYIGWLLHRTAGGIMAGGLFILPGVIAIMGLSYVYAAYGNVGFVEAVFFGLKAAVLAIVVHAVVRVGKRALRNRVMIALAAIAFVAIFFFNVPFPIIIIAAGVIGYFGARSGRPEFAAIEHGGGGKKSAAVDSLLGEALPEHVRPNVGRALRVSSVWLLLWVVPVAALLIGLGQANVFSQIALFFSKMAMVTFGGAYAVLAYVAQQAVEHYHWLQPREMLDGLGMAETTPGPLIMVLQFVGFMAAYRDPGGLSPMVAATLGGLLATWVTFIPCFLWIFLGAPYIETLRGNKGLAGALTAITAAVVGVILNLSIWFGLHTLFRQTTPVRSFGLSFDMPVWGSLDIAAFVLAAAAATAIFRLNVGMLWVLAGSCAAGVAVAVCGGDLKRSHDLVGWAKARKRRAHHFCRRVRMVGTLRFAHPTASHPFRRRQLADLGGGFDLQRSVVDVEAVREFLANAVQEGVVRAAGPHQMRGQRGFVGAHGPDVQIVHLRDAFQPGEIVSHLRKLDAARHAVEREVDAVARQPPPAPEHHSRNHEADRGIEPQPAGQHDDTSGNHHAERNARIGHHMQIGAADIQVAVAAAHEQQRGETVDGDAKRRNRHDRPARDRRRAVEPVDRLDDDAADRDQ